jgi:hypothetical protein
MRERAARLSGTCTVDSAPGRGTRVVVSLPLQDRSAAADPAVPRPAGSILFGHVVDA